MRSRFLPDTQFSQNHISNYGASFKVQKVMLPSLKCQIFHFGSKFRSFTQSSRQQTQFSKLLLCQFLVYMAKNTHVKKLEKSNEKFLKKMHHRQTDRQTDGQMKRTDFIEPLPQSWRFSHVFWKFKNKIWK